MQWQYYPKWHLSHSKIQDQLGDYAWFEHTLCIGPLQFRWRGKPWVNHLRRSPEYTDKIKQILQEDLKTIGFN